MDSTQERESVVSKQPLRPLNYRLGLDVGTNSLGWAVYEVEEDPDKLGEWEPILLADSGVRIFSDGRDDKTSVPLKQRRREKRQARRQRARYVQRRNKLRRVLCEHGLFPYCETCRASNKQRFESSKKRVDKFAPLELCKTCREEQRALQDLSPYELRARGVGAVSGDSAKLSQHQLGRALFHLQQRRGYQSNRVAGSEGYGSALRGVRQILIAMDLLESTSDDDKNREKYEGKTSKPNLTSAAEASASSAVELTVKEKKEQAKALRKERKEERDRASHQYIEALEKVGAEQTSHAW